MQYMVKGADGKEYGPTDVSTLKTWAAEGRLAPHSMLRDFNTGQTMAASAVPGLFETAATAPPVPSAYPRTTYEPTSAPSNDHGGGVLLNVILRSVAAVVFFFIFKGLGVIFAGYAMYYAIQCQQSGSKYGIAAILIAGVAVAAVAVGWLLRLQGAHV